MTERSAAHAALARTYRPRRFGEVTSQPHVAETLRSAVARGRVAHAYLFCGPRGVGKTTAARVLAMALNCPERSPDGEPCGVCDSCARIWAGRTSLDVVEIDAASNRGVDDARDLRERAMYAPTDEHRFKVYIIDEAHMLTREAWNALLKILEEPPPRVIFVFATTEPQKIQQAAPPILSRCQRFDFRRIPVADIVARLRAVLAEEGIEADEEALVPIARRADGGLRDALSLVDQVLSFAGRRVAAEDVRRVLGLVDEELYIELFEILADRRYGDVFRFVQRLLDEGYDLTEFYRGLADSLRILLIYRFEGAGGADVREHLRGEYARLADRFGNGDLLRMLAMVAELDTEGKFRKSANPRTMLEALLLRFAYLDRTVDIETLLSTVAGGGPPGSPAAPAASGRRAAEGGAVGRHTASPDVAAPRREHDAETRPRNQERNDPVALGADLLSPEQHAVGVGVASDERPAEPALATAREALRAIQQAPRDLPQGLGFFLRVARVEEVVGSTVALSLPSGPGLELLNADPQARLAVQRAFGHQLDRPVDLLVREAGAKRPDEPPRRLTPEQARADQLARLTRDNPRLAEAVDQWDLEIWSG